VKIQANNTYYYDFVQASPAKFFSKKNAILKRLVTIGERIEQCHGSRTSLPDSLLIIAKARNIAILTEAIEVWDTKRAY
jgi:iron-sulfur cluster repair protein YtfE (RIC family)